MSIENRRRAPSLNEVKGEVADAELNNVSGGDKATTTKTTTTTTNTTRSNPAGKWIEINSYQ
jgi:hypothetical protein